MKGTFLEYFAGGGMARAGLGDDWECLFANDIDPKKAWAYEKNWGGQHLVVDDVWNVEIDRLPAKADLAWASFPCQDLSLAGSRNGLNAERSGTFWGFIRHIEALRSQGKAVPLVVLENVSGTLTSHGGKDFKAISQALVELDYKFGALIMDASLFLPQSRPRLFVVAVQRELDIPDTLVSQVAQHPWHTKTLQKAIQSLPSVHEEHWVWWDLAVPEPSNIQLRDLIESNPTGVEWHTSDHTDYILSLMDPVNERKVEDAKKAKQLTVGTIYRRTRPDKQGKRTQRAEVRFDGIAGCLRTPSGGSSRQTLLIVEGEDVQSRLLSPREAARLMGLKDGYVLPERYNDAYHVAGDGLVVPVVNHLAKNILNPILAANVRGATKAA